MSETAPDVLARIDGTVGHLTLNRPRQINALTPAMVADIAAALERWAVNPNVEAVLIDGAGDRGLCAGGDIRAVHDGISGLSAPPLEFWAREYEMNSAIAHYPKPYVALMDGICMGGGIGVSAHGSVRIVTERSVLAMPETAIGLCPDVGGLWLLSRSPGQIGTYAALTGARFGAADAIEAGLADLFLPASELPAVLKGMRSGVLPSGEAPPPGVLAAERVWIDSCFAADSVEEIAALLMQRTEPAAATCLATLRAVSPTALKVTLEAIRRAARMSSVDEVLAQDLRVCLAFTRHPDLVEGIRAMVVDKDRSPRWQPAVWEDVSRADVLAFF